jgi:hypothetical protein
MGFSLKESDLFRSASYDATTEQFTVVYRADGKKFVYSHMKQSTAAAIQRSLNPGEDFLKIRDEYPYKQI